MKYKGMSRSHLFLIELIVVVLFFAFASVITVQVFSKAFQLDRETTELNGAVVAVQSAAETDKTIEFSAIDTSEKNTYFDENWNTTSAAKAVYQITSKVEMTYQPAGVMALFSYTASSAIDDHVIFELHTKKYYSESTLSSGS